MLMEKDNNMKKTAHLLVGLSVAQQLQVAADLELQAIKIRALVASGSRRVSGKPRPIVLSSVPFLH